MSLKNIVLIIPCSGVGCYIFSDGCVYKGEVMAGVRHGHGRYENPSTQISYEGDWVHGKRHGKVFEEVTVLL